MARSRAILLGLALLSPTFGVTRAEGPTERIALAGDAAARRDQLPIRRPAENADLRGGRPSGGWWFSTAGIVAVLAVLGVGSLAAKRWKLVPGRETSALEIVGRTFLTSKHAVYLVRAGGRTLLIGTGPQGAPSLLGELPCEAEPRTAPGGLR
jgi:flagellar biogenesis protein FliO